MALNNTTADALATAYCAQEGITDAAAIAHWKGLARLIYSHLATDLTVTLPAASVVTVGGQNTQTGPAAPVPCIVA